MKTEDFMKNFDSFDKEFEQTRASIQARGAQIEKASDTVFKVAAVLIPLFWLAGFASTAVGAYIVYHFLAKFW